MMFDGRYSLSEMGFYFLDFEVVIVFWKIAIS